MSRISPLSLCPLTKLSLEDMFYCMQGGLNVIWVSLVVGFYYIIIKNDYAIYIMPFTLCHLHYAIYIMPFTLCHLHYAIYIMTFTLWHLHYDIYIMPFTLWHLHYDIYIMPFTLCHLHYAIYIMPFTLCHLHYDIYYVTCRCVVECGVLSLVMACPGHLSLDLTQPNMPVKWSYGWKIQTTSTYWARRLMAQAGIDCNNCLFVILHYNI